jgi:hypothetical protein
MSVLRRSVCFLLLSVSAWTLRAEDAPQPTTPTLTPAKNTSKETKPTAENVKLATQYVAQLSAESYMDRAEAKEKLKELGRAAIEPLEAGAQSEDTEIRLRCLEILIAMRGRGFMGVGLAEDNTEMAEDGGNEDSDIVVSANQVIDWRQGFDRQYGVKRPFPADAAGIKTGDKLLEINDRKVRGIKDLMREVILVGPGRVCSVLIQRDGVKMRIPVLLTRNPMLQRQNQFGGIEAVKDTTPQVDLEKEIDFTEDDKRADLKQPEQPAAMQDEIIEIDP